MELDRYNQSFEHYVDSIEEEAESRLQAYRQQCIRKFINDFTRKQLEWDTAFRELLCKSQEIDFKAQSELIEDTKSLEKALSLKFGLKDEEKEPSKKEPPSTTGQLTLTKEVNQEKKANEEQDKSDLKQSIERHSVIVDPFPKELKDYFTNNILIKEFVQIQQQLETNRQQFSDIIKNPSLKQFKNEINLFIRTQINSISNSDKSHLNTKTRMLSQLFTGHQVSFQDRLIQASQHPQGHLYAMDLAAQTFVTVGTRLVNSVPAIAKSMATVINDIIVNNNLGDFKNLIMGNLQERCPYLVPLYARREDFKTNQADNDDVKYKIACGYSYDSKTQSLESEDKFLARMRSMVLIFACVLAEQQDKSQAWTWLASFLSLKPEPVITATVLQAYLQELSKPLSRSFGRQYKKLLDFVKTDYLQMIEEATPNPSDRQSLIKLKNLLADESSLIVAPAMSSLFGSVRF